MRCRCAVQNAVDFSANDCADSHVTLGTKREDVISGSFDGPSSDHSTSPSISSISHTLPSHPLPSLKSLQLAPTAIKFPLHPHHDPPHQVRETSHYPSQLHHYHKNDGWRNWSNTFRRRESGVRSCSTTLTKATSNHLKGMPSQSVRRATRINSSAEKNRQSKVITRRRVGTIAYPSNLQASCPQDQAR
jgi:hypothetical protein